MLSVVNSTHVREPSKPLYLGAHVALGGITIAMHTSLFIDFIDHPKCALTKSGKALALSAL